MTRIRTPLPDQEYLKQTFNYCPIQGVLYWSENRPKTDFLDEKAYNRYLKSISGKLAGYLTKPAKSSKEEFGYWKVTLSGKSYMLHRIIYKMFNGLEPLIVDHINNNHLDNRIENLKESNRQENKMKSPNVNNKSGYRGVFSRKDRSTYEVRITLPKEFIAKDIHVGYYSNLEEAAEAYNLAMKIYYKDITFYENETNFDSTKVDINKTFFKNHK